MIKIEVTGNSLAEVSDKLLAIGASLQRTVSYDADNAAREAAQAKRTVAEDKPTIGAELAKRVRKPKGEAAIGAGNAVPGAATPQAEAAASEPTSDATSAEVPPSEQEAPAQLSFDKDVAPLVLHLVKTKGPEAIKKILEQFGVERASQIDPARYGELVALVQDAL